MPRPADRLVPALDQHPEAIAALPGYVWLDMPWKVRHVPERDPEFAEKPPDAA